MAYSTVDPFYASRYTGNVALYLAPQDSTHYPEGDATSAKLSTITDWKNIARVATAEAGFDTDTDPENNWNAAAGARVVKNHQYVTARYWTVNVERDSPFVNALFNGVRNPFSAESTAAMGAGQSLPIYLSTKPVPVCVKLEIRDLDNTLMQTLYFYADLTPNGSRTYDDKSLKASVRLDVTSSEFSEQNNTTAFTGQTGSAS